MFITYSQLLAFRARRQYLAPDVRRNTPEDVFGILKELQPFPPITGSMPGSAPHPRSRVVNYQDEWSQQWRAAGRLIKGRFMNRNVAYVVDDDFALYAAAFRRPLQEPVPDTAFQILEILEQDGPLPKPLLREFSNLERNYFERALKSLNCAFEVMEIQRKVDWESPWDLCRRAYPNADFDSWEQSEAQAEVLRRFTKAFGAATLVEIADWSGWPQRTIQNLIDNLLMRHDIAPVEIEGQEKPAYIADEDIDALGNTQPLEPFLVVLPPNDPFVLPQWSHLKKQYQSYRLPYCYGVIVLNGEIVGAAWGRYKRRYIYIEDLSLASGIINDSQQIDEILATLESHVSAGSVPIHIYGVNGEIESHQIREILERNGFVWNGEYYFKDAVRKQNDYE